MEGAETAPYVYFTGHSCVLYVYFVTLVQQIVNPTTVTMR